jgi:hypothetical protein
MTGNIRDIPSLDNCGSLSLIVAGGVYDSAMDFIVGEFRDAPDRIAFENEAEMARFYHDIGSEYLAMPFSFRIVDR